jgi:uncharacterized protein
MIGEAEDFLASLGFSQYRVRHHQSVARIEVEPRDIQRFVHKGNRQKIVARFKELGFLYVALDLEGYMSGSLNRELMKNANREDRSE